MIQIGTYVHGGEYLSPEEKLAAIKEAGFDFVALGMSCFAEDNLEDLVELCAQALSSGLICRSREGGL